MKIPKLSLRKAINIWLRDAHVSKDWKIRTFSGQDLLVKIVDRISLMAEIKIMNDHIEHDYYNSKIKINVVDPKFFSKLETLLQLIDQEENRLAIFMQSEKSLYESINKAF